MRIAVASGKGGTGKTTLATNLAVWLSRRNGLSVTYADADVEAPNGHLFLHPDVTETEEVTRLVPELNEAACTGCGLCGKLCAFGAIIVMRGKVMMHHELCHSCGGCIRVCPNGALQPAEHFIGQIEHGTTGSLGVVTGRQIVGEASAVPLIKHLKNNLPKDGVQIIDSPPGTACAMNTAVHETDFLILVTEPTPFGVHDVVLAAKTAQQLGIPAGIVINRDTGTTPEGLLELEKDGTPIIGRIPFRRSIAEAYASGRVIIDVLPEMGEWLEPIWTHVESTVAGEEVQA